MKRRFDVLDGLRGFAMLLVFLNHVDSNLIIHAFPSSFQQYISFFFLSGKMGVSFFFILSGFLMASLYAYPNRLEFVERRYTRIFPPFISMVLCMSIFRAFPQLSLFSRVAILLAIAYSLRIFWIYIVERFHIGAALIKTFLLLQVLIAVWYGFFIMRMPAAWFHSLSPFIQWATTLLVNATLTLPLGDYIPMFDIVYWTLICEVLFYLLYPSLIAPIVLHVQKRSSLVQTILFIFLFPFFFGTSLLFKDVRGLSIMEIEYFVYFFIGIAIAIIAKQKKGVQLNPYVNRLFHPLFFVLLLFIAYFISINSLQLFHLAAILLLSIPLGFVVYGLLATTTTLSRFFSHKLWVFLGTVSYSLYISSTSIIDGMRLLYKPTSAVTNLLFLVVTLIISIALSYALHEIIESPYFMFKPKKQITTSQPIFHKRTLLVLILILFLLIFSTYSSHFNFFSQEKTYRSDNLSDKPLTVSFTSSENNMGILAVPLTHTISSQEVSDRLILTVKIKESNAKNWYSTTETNLANVNKSGPVLFGFPTIHDSRNKKYILEINTQHIPSRKISLKTTPLTVTAIHQMDKKELLTHPFMLLSHSFNKIKSLFSNKTAFIVSLCVFPLLAFILFSV